MYLKIKEILQKWLRVGTTGIREPWDQLLFLVLARHLIVGKGTHSLPASAFLKYRSMTVWLCIPGSWGTWPLREKEGRDQRWLVNVRSRLLLCNLCQSDGFKWGDYWTIESLVKTGVKKITIKMRNCRCALQLVSWKPSKRLVKGIQECKIRLNVTDLPGGLLGAVGKAEVEKHFGFSPLF